MGNAQIRLRRSKITQYSCSCSSKKSSCEILPGEQYYDTNIGDGLTMFGTLKFCMKHGEQRFKPMPVTV